MPPRVITMLTGVKTAELSVVPQGANNKRFALSKEDDPMLFSEVVKNLLATKAEGEDALREALTKSGVTGDAIEAAIGSFRLQHGFADKLSKEAIIEVAKAAGFDVVKAGDKPPKKDDDPKPGDPKPNPFAKEHAAELEVLRKENADNKKETEQLRKELSGVTRGALRKELIVECEKEFAHVPGMSASEQADMLLSAKDAGGDLEKSIRKQWAATSEAISKSPLLHSGGTPTTGGSGDAMGKLDAITKELISKNVELSYAKAFDLAMQQNPALYKEYLNQNPAQTARTY